ncbi:MAG: hypothetical protein H5T69_02495, partial [Chloroflexi bacterium]|nr:hypothetical protein [Chloroflexota bacterium]
MNELRVLLACQWRIWCNGWRRESRQRGQRLSMAFVLPLFIALLFGSTLYFLHYSGLVEMLRLAVILPEARQAANRLSLEALAISSTATFLVISLSALEQAFETFFQAPDLALLLSAPISRRGIFVIKFVANMRWDASMILVLSLPIWLAFSVWLKAPFLFYLALPIAWGLLLVLVSGIGTLLAMTLARIISAARLRQFVISFTMGVGLLLVIGIQGLITRVWQKEQIVSWLNVQWLSRQTWLPSVWLSRALAHFMIGEYAPAWPWLLRLALGAAIGYLAAYIAALRLFRDGWYQAQEAEQRSRRRSKARAVRG